MLAILMRAEHPSVATLVEDLQSRLSPTPQNLSSWYGDVQFLPLADERLYKVRLPGNEEFLIRRSRAWQDLGTLHEIFIEGIYDDHPPIADKTVLDVGGNIGDTAVYFAKRGARVIAYEPDPEMCELARRNVDGNALRADIRNAGIGAATETLRLSATRDGADTKSVTLFPGDVIAQRSHVASLPIRVVAFSEVLAELGTIGLVKLDCQGCEYPALQSVARVELRNVEHIIIECHGDRGELEVRLRACGFSVRRKGAMYLYADRSDEVDRRDPTAPSD